MTQFDWGTMDPFVVDGVQLAALLNNWRDAVYTMQRGPTRPTFVVPGMWWVDDAAGPTTWLIKVYISPAIGDASLFRINTTTGLITLLGGTGSELTAETLIAQGANPIVRWLNPANPIDQKRIDAQLTGAGALRFRMINDSGAETAWLQLNRDGSISSSVVTPAFLVRATTNDVLSGANSLQVFRGTATPVKDYDTTNSLDAAQAYRFVAPSAGKYAFHLAVFAQADNSWGMGVFIRHYTSAGVLIRDYAGGALGQANNPVSVPVSALLTMAINERIEWVWASNNVVTATALALKPGTLAGGTMNYAYGYKIDA